MKTPLLLALLALGAVVSRVEAGPSYGEMRAKFELADAELNKVYKATIAELDKEKAAKLREDERDWIAYRDEMVAHDFHEDENPKLDPDYWVTLAIYARERTAFLHAWSGKHVPSGITGEYSDSYGGTLDLEETKEGINFSINAVRTRAHNEGNIDGTLHRKGDKAYFKQQPGQEELFGPPCELVFTFIDDHIVKIEEKVPDSGAGHNVHYSGEYYKVGALKKTEEKSK